MRLARTACLTLVALALSCTPAAAEEMTDGGGRVMSPVRLHLVFWQPAGSGLHFAPGYVALMSGFAANVAAASGSAENPFGLLGQYRTPYAISYPGPVLDSDRLPASNCRNPRLASGGSGWRVCLREHSLEAELSRVIVRDGLPRGSGDLYVLVTPRGLGNCQGTGPQNCAVGGYQNNGYCGYHDVFDHHSTVFAVIAFVGLRGHCDSDEPRPNGSPADPAISTLTHELAESVTDPFGSGWTDDAGNEIADVCDSIYGNPIGGSGTAVYNEVINGGHYWVQELWSNASHHCQQRAPADTISATVPATGAAGQSLTFTASGNAPLRSITDYSWDFGDGSAPVSGASVQHSYSAPGTYTVTVTETDSWGDRAATSGQVSVS
jgi:hypothetical protein